MKKKLLILLVCILAIVLCCATAFLMRPVLNIFMEPSVYIEETVSNCKEANVYAVWHQGGKEHVINESIPWNGRRFIKLKIPPTGSWNPVLLVLERSIDCP